MTSHFPLTLLLLVRSSAESFFLVSEPPSDGSGMEEPEKGWIARLRFRLHTAYESLKRHFDYQENVCATLRHASSLKMLHPASISSEEARSRLEDFFAVMAGKHRRWAIIDAIVALFGVLLTPVPGPNIFFLYPAVRSLSHYLALRGVRRSQTLGVSSCETDEALTRIQEALNNLDGIEAEVKELGATYNIHRLRSLLEQI
jgi:hypothetical protein